MSANNYLPSDLVNAFGRGIRIVRLQRGLTLKQLQDQSFVGYMSISLVERGVQGLSLHSALALSQALGIPVDELVRIGLEEGGAKWQK